jgi:hypothetical protein
MAKFRWHAQETGSPMTACKQPGCTGMVIDGYCDVCGSPAGAVPFLPAAVSAASPAPADQLGPTAVPAPSPAPGPIGEEILTQRIPRVTMPRLQLATQERADSGTADPEAVDAQQVDREKVGSALPALGKLTGRWSSPRASATAPRTIGRESMRPSCPMTYVRQRCARSTSFNGRVTRALSPTTSEPGSTRFSTCRGARRPRTG